LGHSELLMRSDAVKLHLCCGRVTAAGDHGQGELRVEIVPFPTALPVEQTVAAEVSEVVHP